MPDMYTDELILTFSIFSLVCDIDFHNMYQYIAASTYLQYDNPNSSI